MGEVSPDAQALVERFRNGERRALARAISLVENRGPGYRELLSGLYPLTGRAYRLGVTGPPGAGKSTLVDGLAALLAGTGVQVGIIAVDPTSPFTGGALLGDRVRMNDLSATPNIYIRSMATRGATGGIASATHDVSLVLDAFGFDVVVVETVGVGQVEIDVMNVCDTVALVFVPESGDAIQTLKAGLIEIGHLFLVNKADRPGALDLASELEQVLATRREPGAWSFPVLTTEAVRRKGLTEFQAAVAEHRTYLGSGGRLLEARRKRAAADLENALRDRTLAYLYAEVLPAERLDRLARDIVAGKRDPYQTALEIWEQFLQKPETGSQQEHSHGR